MADINGDNAMATLAGGGTAPTPPRRRSWRRYVLLAIVLIAGAVFGLHWLEERRLYEVTDDATLVGDVIPVTSEIAGLVTAVKVSENDTVKPGQLLVQIDPRPFQIALAKAQADLHVAEKQAAASKSSIGLAQAQAAAQATTASGGESEAQAGIGTAQQHVDEARQAVASARSRIDEERAALAPAQAQYDRIAELASKGYATQQELDAAQGTLNTAKARVATAQHDLQQAQARLAQAQAEVTQARGAHTQSVGQQQTAKAAKLQTDVTAAQAEVATAAVERAQAAVASAQFDLDRTKITALFPGRIGRKAVAPGMQVAPGQNLLALVPPRIWIVANFKETQLRRLRIGQAVVIEVDALPGVLLSGRIDSFSPASGAVFSLIPPENATGNFTKVVQRVPVKIVLNDDELAPYKDRLTPGMSVNARVKVQ